MQLVRAFGQLSQGDTSTIPATNDTGTEYAAPTYYYGAFYSGDRDFASARDFCTADGGVLATLVDKRATLGG